jgi:glutamine---fructose-6-phosphate transaminase (isomerizing)
MQSVTSLIPSCSYVQVVMEVVSQLEGAFALLIRSTRFPDELMAAKKGSPLLVGECPFDVYH